MIILVKVFGAIPAVIGQQCAPLEVNKSVVLGKKRELKKRVRSFFGKMQQMEAEKIYHMCKQLFKVCLWHSEHSRALFFSKV